MDKPVIDPTREAEAVDRFASTAVERHIPEETARVIIKSLIDLIATFSVGQHLAISGEYSL